ncbi:apolipoprotein D [Latimeria chalumnae]|uniref:Apolipoprotein D n=1 Tax=Latimeria chalumnae TaxID=7897 RepID=M3XIR4_LATCH|nr:PREDICTED: apolipoprotein D [Latimeria chalumnae]XP_014340180.1 PREDICTED: apolipoprotein D [Latimeria chalumnae]XP_014340181.1 PREDICTED: apolipoprotein D [Latimeria chalumnae]XP_014340182.1 PREDICTED: apolipoprotein D [Latimeria chalumnae]|eukprot:XP_014340179.1 PREDICTED: apolipoprotein D [Latimeria chalumnae]
MMLVLLLAFVSFTTIEGQIYHLGKCPDPPVQQDFQIKQYLGKWYEIEKIPYSFEKGNCAQMNYTQSRDGRIKVINQEVLFDGTVTTFEGNIIEMEPREPAKFGLSYFFFMPYMPKWVISTDYISYSLEYSCTSIFNLFYIEFVWILSRSKELPDETVDLLKNILVSNNIEVDTMTITKQRDCPDLKSKK